MEKSRHHFFEEITIVKGIAILLVILGHAITQTGQEGVFLSKVQQVIYSFHMPLFFFASGFLSVRLLEAGDWRSRISYGGNRTLRLLIPYFVMGLLYMFAGAYYFKRPDMIGFPTLLEMAKGGNPDVELWFLYVLWLITVFMVLVVRKRTLWFWTVIALGGIWASSYALQVNPNLYLFLFYVFYLLLGMLVRCYYPLVRKALSETWALVVLLLFFIMGNTGSDWLTALGTVPTHMVQVTLFVVTAVSGLFLFLSLAIRIADGVPKDNGGRSFLLLCGDYAMDLYIIAEPIKVLVRIVFWEHLHWNYLLCTALCFVIPVAATLVISRYVVRRSRVLSLLFLGKLS